MYEPSCGPSILKEIDFKEELIHRLKSGDRKAQYQFYATYADAMYNICCRMLPNEMDAQDVLQTSFMDSFRHMDKYDFRATVGAWLKRIVINNCINHLRRKKLMIVELEDRSTFEPEPDIPESHINIDVVKESIRELSDGYRAVLNLYLFEGYDHNEIGEILNISASTSKSQYSRAKQRLKRILINKRTELYGENER